MTDDSKQHDDTNPQDDQTSDPLAEALKKAQQQEAANKEAEEGKITDESELAQTKEELTRMTEAAQRAMADLANFKRRTEEERAGMAAFAGAELIKAILPAIDNFERSLNHIPEGLEGEVKNWADGITNTLKQLHDALEKQGLTKMKTVGEKFDPNIHEAVLQGPGEKDIITEEMESGYMLGERVVRTAKVKVGSGEQ